MRHRYHRRAMLLVPGCLVGLAGCSAALPARPAHDVAVRRVLTRAERSEYHRTSSYDDVMAYLDALQAGGAPIRVQFMGRSAAGRPIPLVIAADPPVLSAGLARRLGRVVVYVQANIHAGEVEGKEAALMLLREMAGGEHREWLDRLVLLVAPIYNVDGNEVLGDGRRVRPSQDGPDRVGQRASGEGFDLNRDCIKARSLEMRAALADVYNAWDPDVVMDLHTTNGTRHGYRLTYSPPLNPNTEASILSFTREELIPVVQRRMKMQHGMDLFDYGNVEPYQGRRVWATFGEEGRYVTNYAGLRNRIAVLSEAASFQPFRVRVDVTRRFVTAVLDEVARRAAHVADLTRRADERVIGWGLDARHAPRLGVRFELASRGDEFVALEKEHPDDEEIDHRSTPTALERVKLPILDRFRVTRTARFPPAYLIPATEQQTVDLLLRHGIRVEQLRAPWTGYAEQFRVSEAVLGTNLFQGGRLLRLEGEFFTEQATYSSATFVVRTAQPLGILAFHLLEPEGLDGAGAWGFIESPTAAGTVFPIHKTLEPVQAPLNLVPARGRRSDGAL